MYTQQELEIILAKEEIKDFEKDIRFMTKREIRKHFSFKTKRKINPTKLIKNLIWQTYTWIKAGKRDPVDGNIRSLWYISLKPVLSRLGMKVSNDKYSDKLYNLMTELIIKHRILKYSDFGFFDTRESRRWVGKKNGHLVLFIEKDGLLPWAKDVAVKHDATAISLKGFPSYLGTEFFLRDMAKNGLLDQPLILFSVVDYDPSGYWIAKEFRDQLINYGAEVAEMHSLVNVELFNEEELALGKYKLGNSSRVRGWMELTGGFFGEAYGLEIDALGGKKVRKTYEDAIQPYLAGAGASRASRALCPERTAWLRWLAG